MTKRLSVVLAALAVAASGADAQTPRPLELGIDAGVTIGLGDNSITTVNIPAQALRVGFFMTPQISVEPKLGLIIISGDGTLTTYRAEVGVLYHTGTPDPVRSGLYVRPFVGLVGFDAPGETGDTNGLLGLGVGLKVPLVSRLSTRFEANLAHAFGDGGSNEIGLLAGLSFFTR